MTAPISVLENILAIASRCNASDIYLQAQEYPGYQVGNEEFEFPKETFRLSPDHMRAIIDEMVASPHQKKFLQENLYLEFTYVVAKSVEESETWGGGRYRVEVANELGHYDITFRRLAERVPAFKELNLPEDQIADLCGLDNGLILITGPVDAGKSTTLASMLNHINLTRQKRITIIEEPREFFFKKIKSRIKQRELIKDIRSYADAWHVARRDNTNVLCFGETRDDPSAIRALLKAASSALVFTTMHSSSASQAINSLIYTLPDVEREEGRLVISRLLRAVIFQILVKTYDGAMYPCLEIIRNNSSVSALIRNKEMRYEEQTNQWIPYTLDKYVDTHGKKGEGMQLLDHALKQLVTDGIIHPDEAIKNARNKRDIELSLVHGHYTSMVSEDDDEFRGNLEK